MILRGLISILFNPFLLGVVAVLAVYLFLFCTRDWPLGRSANVRWSGLVIDLL